MNYLPDDKVLKIKKFRRYEDSLRALTAQILIRTIACSKLNKDKRLIKFAAGPNGKPYIDNEDNFHFNISHSGDWVVCAVSYRPVGIDVERIKEIDFAIAKRFFSKEEAKDLFSKEGEEEKKDYFFKLWTLKESYIKADGRGLSLPLDSFSFKIKKNKIFFTSQNELKDCFFKIYDIDNEYKVSVCSLECEFPENITIKKIDGLINEFLLK
ncbi:MAG: 4'-phosphopantetheinyl transferase superfamily protein [Clostridium sp.]|nr:4'-phosphopantetheinyl transferase superfamily protein [Clostridium sp.]